MLPSRRTSMLGGLEQARNPDEGACCALYAAQALLMCACAARRMPAGKAEQGLAMLSQLLGSAAQMLPAAQRCLHLLPEDSPALGLRLSDAAAAAADGMEDAADMHSASLPIVAGEQLARSSTCVCQCDLSCCKVHPCRPSL